MPSVMQQLNIHPSFVFEDAAMHATLHPSVYTFRAIVSCELAVGHLGSPNVSLDGNFDAVAFNGAASGYKRVHSLVFVALLADVSGRYHQILK